MPVFLSILFCEYLNNKLGSAKYGSFFIYNFINIITISILILYLLFTKFCRCVLLFSAMVAIGASIIAVAPNFPIMFAGIQLSCTIYLHLLTLPRTTFIWCWI